ncbi:outer membrane transport energization protein ExbD [Ruegeria faecimaris]|uniref:Outer membrane transport energization protein ExbD n=2 Tax=Ruegeria faecimaris TaxID=686389 RepID=A0A521DRC9_9RHOB|nr:biopolymer transporter ExbD [Ruegeria faecimaris]SMO74152.1 outer membrane transport energization protein ExbD [Ruegeria faecimaris]
MALEVQRKRRKRLSMTSLIDVIFLLLLFFMLTSTFSKFAEIEFSTASVGGAEPDQAIRFIKLNADRILVDGAPVPLAQVAPMLLDAKSQVALISLGPRATSQQLIDLFIVLAPVENLRTQVLG